MNYSEAERRLAHEQALASTRLAGHVPSAEFLADCEEQIKGLITHDEVRRRSHQRALAAEAAAQDNAQMPSELLTPMSILAQGF